MEKNERSGLLPSRLESLSDSVFAVALTLLILNITVPILASFEQELLSVELMNLWPKVLVYASSFFVIGVFWMGHRIMFNYIELVNVRLILLNNFLLLMICFIPFSANLIGTYPWTLPASIVYGSTLFIASIFYIFVWKYAVKHHLIKHSLEDAFIKRATKALYVAPLLYFFATIGAFLSPVFSFILFFIIPILYILPGPIDELLPKKGEGDF